MTAMIVLIAVSLIVAVGFLLAFIWSVKGGQYEDKYTPSVRILFDDETKIKSAEIKQQKLNKKNIVI